MQGMKQLDLFPATRRPICVECGKLGTRWFQPLIGTENFCSKFCVNLYVASHKFDGQAQAIHDRCHPHFDPTYEAN